MKHFFLPESGNFYKANLHCHTRLSDGALTPGQIKEVYKSHGWCDHEGVADTAPHFGELVPHENTAAWVNRVIREAKEHGFIVSFNHPSWSKALPVAGLLD